MVNVCGHPDKIEKARGMCRNCYERWLRKTNPEYKKRQEANSRAWVLRNPEKEKIHQAKRREKYKNDPILREKKFYSRIKRKYNCSEEQYKKLLLISNFKCMLCYRDPARNKRLHLDHCHETLKIRGLLCSECNWYMSKIDADIQILDRIRDYVKNNY